MTRPIATLTSGGWECVNPLPGPADVLARYAPHTPIVPGLDAPSLLAALTHSIVPEIGPMPYWRADALATARPTIVDRLGIVRTCHINEARFYGARRVENLIDKSNALNQSPWSVVGTATITLIGPLNSSPDLVDASGQQCFELSSNGASNALVQVLSFTGSGLTTGVLRPVRHTLSFEAYSGTQSAVTAEVYVSGGTTAGTITPTLTAGWRRYSLTCTPDGTSAYRVRLFSASSGTVRLRNIQLEDMVGEAIDGSSNVPPSEYVSRGSITVTTQSTAVFHGAMVDGVKYFATEHANTVNNTTRVVTEADGAALTLAKNGGTMRRLMLDPSATNRVTGAETLAGWTINGSTSLTVTAGAATGPDGLQSAVRLTEDSASTEKFARLAFATGFADNRSMCVQVYAAAGTRSILRLSIRDKAGTVIRAWFNLAASVPTTQVDAGGVAYMWREGAFWLCSLVDYNIGSGANPEMHIGVASAMGGTSYLGTGGTLFVWGAMAVNKEHPQSYFSPDRFASANRTGHALAYPNVGIVGRNDFAWYAEQYCLYDTGIPSKTNDGATQTWDYVISGRANNPNADYCRVGLGRRPYAETPPGYARGFVDRYLGEPTAALRHRTSQFYPAGSYVVPQDTTTNNGNSRELYFTAAGGTSGGSAPTWNPGGSTSDGTITWIVAPDPNPSLGKYDPNDGVHLSINVPAMTLNKLFLGASSVPELWGCTNGVDGVQTTRPFPIDLSEAGTLPHDLDEFRIGRDTSPFASMSSCIGNLQMWDRPISQALGKIATA